MYETVYKQQWEVVGNCGQLLVDSSVKSGIILSKSASTRPDPDPRLEHAQLPISEPAKTQCIGMLSLSERAKGPSRDPSARQTIKEFRRGKVLSTGRICLSLDPTRQSPGSPQVLFCIMNAVFQRGAHGRHAALQDLGSHLNI